MTMATLSERDWQIRLHIYRHLVDHGRPPTFAETARSFAIPADDARQAYRRLHEGHALFLEPSTDAVRMANPLSAVPTPYRVYVDGRRLWVNCAWDSLGIPAMLHVDAQIEAVFTPSGDAATYAITAGHFEAASGVVHFPLPFRQWYDNLIHT